MASPGEVADLLRESEATVALTGAGLSKASGVPTYRGPDDGLWRDSSARQWATREAFEADPAEWYANFWRFYNLRQGLSPSAGHYALSAMVEASVIEGIVTQNIDGFDRRAGTPEAQILEVHGNDRSLSCTRVGKCDFSVPTVEWLSANDQGSLPCCPHDGKPLKPDIILFNDDGSTVPEHVAEDWRKAWDVIATADTLMVVGTTLAVPTWAGAVADHVTEGKPIIVINPDETPADIIAKLVVHSPAEEALPAIRDLTV